MPRSSDVALTCPCGTQFTATIYHAVNVTLEPRLLYRLLAGQLNVSTCPNCGRQVQTAQPFVYHDMKRELFAYVYPHTDVPPEDRDALLEHLREAYVQAVGEAERLAHRRARPVELPKPTVRRSRPADDLWAKLEPDAPPMQVIFGTSELIALVESLLEPEEKMAKAALTARGADAAARERMLMLARGLADQMQCDTYVDDDPEEYTVWIYGPRVRVGAIAKALNQPA
jgi:hypothetical protein